MSTSPSTRALSPTAIRRTRLALYGIAAVFGIAGILNVVFFAIGADDDSKITPALSADRIHPIAAIVCIAVFVAARFTGHLRRHTAIAAIAGLVVTVAAFFLAPGELTPTTYRMVIGLGALSALTAAVVALIAAQAVSGTRTALRPSN